MKATVKRLDILHEILFAKPAFELARSAPEVLRIFYESISPRYQIPAEHMSVVASNVLSDLVIRLGLFQNTATLEIRPQKMLLLFTNIRDKESVQVIKDVLALAYDARQKVIPDAVAGTSRFLLHAWLSVEGGEAAARNALKKSAVPASAICPQTLGAEVVTHHLKANVVNEADRWDMLIFGEPSAIPEAHIFVSVDISFRAGTTYSMLGSQIEFVEGILPKVFKSIDLEIAASGEGAA
jgi:hypothetical protein